MFYRDFFQPNPVVSVPDSLLSEDSPAGNIAGEEEEGVVSDPGTEILPESDDKMKVNNLSVGMIVRIDVHIIIISRCSKKGVSACLDSP